MEGTRGAGGLSGPLASPGYWLHQAALAWKAELDGRLRRLGLTHTQFILLATVGWLETVGGGPPGQQEVADGAGTDRQMTSRVVRTLADHGLIARLAHQSNARSLRLTLTPQGRELARQAIVIAQDVDARFFGADPAGIRDSLRGIAEKRD
ncbi:MarR family winged helix-turn-helix transcriptional regulator [Actinocrispum wychmicini]|uniref:DNA-binding MarR family transcriptional regulator n=1 Tax=Actinocrispum wychmicini TaxID=1213861 RepID=A0A4R2K6Y4_9PSEU|nr:MarR family transcriptional regulator [Actinocrispum wychmicini]TCO65716.1 DNA-binding MarR family transcriptional regulator [Actinocrispum wychmicini]